MTEYIVARLIGVVPTLLLLVLAVVVLVRIVPGNVIDAALADQPQLSEEDRAAIEEQLGLSKPIYEQYFDYVSDMARGSFGESLWSQRSVIELVQPRLLVTFEILLLAMAGCLLIGIPAGLLAAVKANTVFDYAIRVFAATSLSVPSFIIATYVLLLPAIWWGYAIPHFEPWSAGAWPHLVSLMIPAAILAVDLSAPIIRFTRTSVLEALRQDYTRTARAKGLRSPVILFRHVLRNSLIPVVSVVGLQVVALFSGVVIIEQIFGIRGIGDLMISAFTTRDYTVIQGLTVILGCVALFVNLAIDVSYFRLDPRLRK